MPWAEFLSMAVSPDAVWSIISLEREFHVEEVTIMRKFVCNVCGYVYDEAEGDPDNGIAPGTTWEALGDDFVCPLCGVGKEDFSEQ